MDKSRVWSIDELRQLVEGVFYENFSEFLFWCSAEIGNIKQYGKRYYIDLVEYGNSGKVKAKITGIERKGRIFERFLKSTGHTQTSIQGQEVMLQGYFSYSVKWGLSISIVGFSKEFQKGKKLEQLEVTIKTLKKLGLYTKNRQKTLPAIPLRLALVSSAQSEGLRDFSTIIDESGINFVEKLYSTPVEGDTAIDGVVSAMENIKKDLEKGINYDAIVILRGGGGKEGFAWQNSLEVCKVVANASLPVFVAIGHTADDSLLDRITRMAKKTPSDAAWWFIERINEKLGELEYTYETINRIISEKFKKLDTEIDSNYTYIRSFSPENILKKGYAYLQQQDKILGSGEIKSLKAGEQLEIETHSVIMQADITSIKEK